MTTDATELVKRAMSDYRRQRIKALFALADERRRAGQPPQPDSPHRQRVIAMLTNGAHDDT